MSKKSLIIPLVVLLAAGGSSLRHCGHLTGWQGNRPEQETDDAYLRADMTPLSTRISGMVRKVNVNDFQSVKAGQALIELDDEDYRATLNQTQAARAASEASLADNQAAKRIQDAQIDTAKAGIVQAEAAIKRGQSRCRLGFTRTRSLLWLNCIVSKPCSIRRRQLTSSWKRPPHSRASSAGPGLKRGERISRAPREPWPQARVNSRLRSVNERR